MSQAGTEFKYDLELAGDPPPVKQIDPNLTGPEAIHRALKNLDLNRLEEEQHEIIRRKLKSKRPRAVQVLNILEGMKKSQMRPEQFMVRSIPVIPAVFRPFSVVGNAFVPGDANELYKDFIEMRDAYHDEKQVFGEHGAGQTRLALYDTAKALYGYGEPVKAKTKQRGVSGFLKKVTGTGPKFSFVQRRLLSKPQDNVSRGTITVDPDLTLDEIGVPEEMAWKIYAPYIQRRLVMAGHSPKDAILSVKNREEFARKMLEREMVTRPVIYSRAPSWHKFNVVAGRPKLIQGDTIAISPLVTTGLNADFDGDALHLHVPSQDDAVKEAWDKLLPSRMLFSNRDTDNVMPVPKQELILGMYTADKRPAKKKWSFPDEATALKSIQAGNVPLSDEVEFPGSDKLGMPKEAAQKKSESPIDRLLRAKAESDRGNYPLKHRIMHEMMAERPEDFEKDDDRGHAQGVTHKPTGFRMHLPRTRVLPKVQVKAADLIPGGLGDDKPDSDFSPKELKKGLTEELDHSKSKAIRKEIVKDHLTEDPKFYTHEKEKSAGVTDREQKGADTPEYALGIPDREDEGDISRIQPGDLLDYVVQEHHARRAGRHFDVRLGDKERGLYSWATKKGLPQEPRTPISLFRQPLHAHEYGQFEGEIPEGYGAGTVHAAEKGRALVTESGPEGFSFATDKGRWRMVPPRDPQQGWLVIKAGDPPPLRHVKEHMPTIHPEHLAAWLEKQQEAHGSPKIDGALQVLRFRNNKPELFSHRTSKRTGQPIEHTQRVFESVPHVQVPKELRDQEFLGELYGERDGKVIPPQELGGILNSGLIKAVETKRDRGIRLRLALHGIAGSELPHAQKRELMARVAELLPEHTEVIPEVSSRDEILKLLEDVKAGRHPKTHEGIVVVGADGRPRKVKLRDEADVYIAQTFPGEGRLRGGPGGFMYSDRPGGQLLGRVGTGFDDETRARLEEYVGRTARIGHQGRYHGGAYRAPSFLALHEDIPEKEASEGSLWDKVASEDRVTELLEAARKDPGLDRSIPDDVTPITDAEGNVVGIYNTASSMGGNPKIDNIYIDPAHRRKGHAERVAREFRAKNPGMVWFSHKDNEASKALASKIGLVDRTATAGNILPTNVMYGEPDHGTRAAALWSNVTQDPAMRLSDLEGKLADLEATAGPKEAADVWISAHWLEQADPSMTEVAARAKEVALQAGGDQSVADRLTTLEQRLATTGSLWGKPAHKNLDSPQPQANI